MAMLIAGTLTQSIPLLGTYRMTAILALNRDMFSFSLSVVLSAQAYSSVLDEPLLQLDLSVSYSVIPLLALLSTP